MVRQFISDIFSSNTYSISSPLSKEEVYLIDCGVYEEVLNSLEPSLSIKGIFITHYHYDHISKIDKWLNRFPDLIIYGTEITKLGIASDKKNFSFYHDDPISLEINNFKILQEGEEVVLWRDFKIKSVITEGHCEGSASFVCNNFVFTGDALIPNIPIVTKLKTGNKLKARHSVEKIKSLCDNESIICPGHFDMTPFLSVSWEKYEAL